MDSICVNQNDERHKLQQIQKMSSIYRDAYACIVSMCGSSMNDGLARVDGSSRVTHPQLSCSIDGMRLVGLFPTLSQQTHNTKWGSRSWTLQESLLSHRCIYISDHQAYFECNAMQCSESLDASGSWIHNTDRTLADVRSDEAGAKYGHGVLRNTLVGHGVPGDHMMVYGTLVSLYSWRSMTKSSDALNAFSGILQHLKELAYVDGFFWGLPLSTFRWSVLWCRTSQHTRRSGFPAWSWAGWHGRIHPGWPIDIYEGSNLRTAFNIWQASKDQLELLPLSLSSLELSKKTSKLDQLDDIFDSIEEQSLVPQFSNRDFVKAEKEGILFVDCVICDIEFIIRSSLSHMDYTPFYHYKVEMNGRLGVLRLTNGAPPYYYNRTETQSNLALVSQELIYGTLYMHFLHLEIDEKGYAMRKSVFMLEIYESRLEALDKMRVERRKVFLV